MKKLLKETRQKAYLFLREFGFDEDDIEPTINKGLKELEETLAYLSDLIEHHSEDKEEIENALHGLKGLLFQLGNHDVANTVEKLRYSESVDEVRKWLDSL